MSKEDPITDSDFERPDEEATGRAAGPGNDYVPTPDTQRPEPPAGPGWTPYPNWGQSPNFQDRRAEAPYTENIPLQVDQGLLPAHRTMRQLEEMGSKLGYMPDIASSRIADLLGFGSIGAKGFTFPDPRRDAYIDAFYQKLGPALDRQEAEKVRQLLAEQMVYNKIHGGK